jgi:hypothetical protein
MLLVVDSNDTQIEFINDNTVEGAVILMEKIGHMLDTKLGSIQSKEDKKPGEIETV